ncbi:hypothetical protein OBBRIDRAFT_844333 [Obba rivulosa]|uniref:Oxidase ustYa n=1 Tax=Obba rivulosa TaxID=1052685 RepID=A0A8E2APZ7_9APHY|nr:hypothetical protein OBBRIDRAFT_844333 [Obba rivulosa]
MFIHHTILRVVGLFFIFAGLLNLIVGQYYSRHAGTKLTDFTFEGDDYPAYYPYNPHLVSLTPEDTVHYQINSTNARREWQTIFPPGGGFLRLGPNNRIFGFALFHQFHCLIRLREAIHEGASTPHVHHCLNYLRQTILCDANPTLEPVLPSAGERSVFSEVPHVCKDWTETYRIAAENYAAYLERKANLNGSMYI